MNQFETYQYYIQTGWVTKATWKTQGWEFPKTLQLFVTYVINTLQMQQWYDWNCKCIVYCIVEVGQYMTYVFWYIDSSVSL